ncbi:translation initiation factor IF-3 [Patescibacteria group bacterium]
MAVKYKRYRSRPKQKRYFVNNRIRSPELRVIIDTGENIGVISTQEALEMARSKDLDLVVISEKANPPVAKILEFSKFLYEERKKSSTSKAKSKKSETKEFVFGPSIGKEDLNRKIGRTREFLEDGNRVKVTVRFRGREITHPEVGMEKIEKMIGDLAEVAKTDEEPKLKGRLISITFSKK